MRDSWVETTLGDVVKFCRNRIDPLALNPDEILRHWSIPVLDETGGPRDESAREIGSHKFRVQKNAVVFSLLNPRIPRFALVVGGDNVVCSTEFAVMQPGPKMHENFLFVLASSDVFHQRVNSLANGTTKSRERVKSSDLENVSILLPPFAEQNRIVDLLSAVDSYIDSLQQQVDSARSARNAVLHELLSAGGDDWTQTTLGDIAAINPEAANGLSLDDEIVYVDLASVSAETGISTDLFRGAFGDAPGRARRVIRSQDVLVSTVRPYLKGFAQVPSFLDGEIASTGFAVLRANPQKTLPGFIWAIVGLTGFVGHLMDRATGSSYPAVRPNDVASFAIELPPLEEQKRIVDLVSSMDEVIAASEQSVAEAKNLRSGLLSDLLSGEHEIPSTYDKFLKAA